VNRRQWKKACKKAALEVEQRWPGQYKFEPAEGDETVYAPHRYQPPGKPRAGFNRRMWRIEHRYASVPKGASIVWERASYEYDEWDCRTALDILDQMEFVESVDWEAMAAACTAASERTTHE